MIDNLSGDKKKSKPRQKQETRFDRIQNARKEYGKLKTTRAIVDTDNIFMFCGKRYKISYTKYQPEKTKVGDYYELDYVICAQTPGGGLLFFDPEFYRAVL